MELYYKLDDGIAQGLFQLVQKSPFPGEEAEVVVEAKKALLRGYSADELREIFLSEAGE